MATTRDIDRVIRTYIDPKVTDLTFKQTPWIDRCKKKAVVKASLGRYAEFELEYAQGQAGAYNELDVIDRQRTEILQPAVAYLADYYAQLTISWKDMKTCRGPEDVVDLIQVKTKNATKTLANTLATDSISGSATASPRTFTGIQTFIYSTYNTVEGITGSSSSNTWWNNQYTAVGGTVTIPDIITMAAKCSDGTDTPTVLLTDKFIWAYIWANLLQPQEMYTQGKYNMAENLPMVSGYPMIWDASCESSGATGGNIYFINENYLKWYILASDNMKYWPFMKADKQFAFSCQWSFSAMQVVTNRARQGRLGTITT